MKIQLQLDQRCKKKMQTAIFIVTSFALVFSFVFKHNKCVKSKFECNNPAHPQPQSDLQRSVAAFHFVLPSASLATVSFFTLSKARADGYLVAPTSDFKDQEAKNAAFLKIQDDKRKKWDIIFARFLTADETAKITTTLNEMTTFISQLEGIPAGVKKKDIVRVSRAKKFDGYKIRPMWTVEVETAYQQFVAVFNEKLKPFNVSFCVVTFNVMRLRIKTCHTVTIYFALSSLCQANQGPVF